MEISYKKLWKVLIDKDMKKKDLQAAAGISWASVTKLSKGESVSMEVLMKVCKTLECNIGDIMDLIPEECNNCLSNDALFKVQSDVIRHLAAEKSCVFVGRCADYILREHPRCANVFISASKEDRITRLCAMHHIDAEAAEEMIEKADKRRSEYYNYYSYKTWGAAATYHLCVDSSSLGVEETVRFIEEFVVKKLQLIL